MPYYIANLICHIVCLSIHSRIAALPFVRLILSDLTFASPVLKGKTREDYLRGLSRGVQSHTNKHKAVACIIPNAYMAGSFILLPLQRGLSPNLH